jgi:hypothetical protein
MAICAPCDATARMIETTSPIRYGLRNPSSRAKVTRYGVLLGPCIPEI